MGAATTQEMALVLPSQDEVRALIKDKKTTEINELSRRIVRQNLPFVDVEIFRAAEEILRETYNYLAPVNLVPRIPEHFGVQINIVSIPFKDIEQGGEVFRVSGEWTKRDGTKVPAKYDINARALMRLADAAGIGWLGSVRHDDGSDSFYCDLEVHGIARKFLTGEKSPISGRKQVDLREGSQETKEMSPKQLSQARRFVLEHAETKAKKRAIRHCVALPGNFTQDFFTRPIAIPMLVFDSRNVYSQAAEMVHHQMVLQAATSASSMLFGGGQPLDMPMMPAFTGQPQHVHRTPPPSLPPGGDPVDHDDQGDDPGPGATGSLYGEPF